MNDVIPFNDGPVVDRLAPDARRLKSGRVIFVNLVAQIEHAATLFEGKRLVAVGLFLRRLLRIDANNAHRLVDRVAQFLHSGPFGRGDLKFPEIGVRAEFAEELQPILKVGQIALIKDEERLRIRQSDVVFVKPGLARQTRLAPLQAVENVLTLLDSVVVAKIDHEQNKLRAANIAVQIALKEVGRNRRRVDELHKDVFPRHHAGRRSLRRKRIRRDLRLRFGKEVQQLALARVRTANNDNRARALARNLNRLANLFARALRRLDLLFDVGDLRLEHDLHLLARLVLWNLGEHDLKPFELFFGRLRATVLFFRAQILRS